MLKGRTSGGVCHVVVLANISHRSRESCSGVMRSGDSLAGSDRPLHSHAGHTCCFKGMTQRDNQLAATPTQVNPCSPSTCA
jgi:hypothetical protein